MDDLTFDVLQPAHRDPAPDLLSVDDLLDLDAPPLVAVKTDPPPLAPVRSDDPPLVATQTQEAAKENGAAAPEVQEAEEPASVIASGPQSVPAKESEYASPEAPAALPPRTDDQPHAFSLVAPYCNINTLFSLALVSRDVNRAVTVESVWRPLCRELGVSDKESDSNDLLSLASAYNVLDIGYVAGPNASYTTFCRAYCLLRPLVANPKQAVAPPGQQVPLSHTDKALLLTSATKLSNILRQDEECSAQEISSLESVVAEEKNELQDELSRAMEKEIPVGPLLTAYDVWWQRLGCDDMRQQAVDIYYDKHAPDLDANDAFSFDSESDTKTVSTRKLSIAFQALASYFSGSRRTLGDDGSGIPVAWRGFMKSVFFDRFTRLVTDYANSVLHLTELISEQEYLNTVPKVYAASKSLMESKALDPTGDWNESDLKELLTTHFIDSMVEEFCTRQLRYFKQYSSDRVQKWTDSISERETETERFIWSSVPRRRDRKNFVTAFKWAVSSLNLQEDQSTQDSGPELSATEALSTPQTEFEAQTAVLVSKFRGMEALVSLELVINIVETCRAALHRFKAVNKELPELFEPMFTTLVDTVGGKHIKHAFKKAIKVLNAYDPKRFGRLVISMERSDDDSDNENDKSAVVEPLVIFTELVNLGDLVQQMLHVFFEEELVSTRVVRKSNFAAPSVTTKRKFEQMLDDMLAEGLSRGIDVLMDQVEFTLVTEQLGSDYLPVPMQEVNLGPTAAALKVIDLVKSHLSLLKDSTEKTLFDVFQQEVGMRLFTAISKHIKAQKISVDGAVTLISDVNAYYDFMLSLKQKSLYPYYEALKQVAQLYLIDTANAKQLGLAMSDVGRYNGAITTEELVEFVKRRQDWPLVRGKVERVLYGVFECTIC